MWGQRDHRPLPRLQHRHNHGVTWKRRDAGRRQRRSLGHLHASFGHEHLDHRPVEAHVEGRADRDDIHTASGDDKRSGRILGHRKMGFALLQDYTPFPRRKLHLQHRPAVQFHHGAVFKCSLRHGGNRRSSCHRSIWRAAGVGRLIDRENQRDRRRCGERRRWPETHPAAQRRGQQIGVG